jgi:hypothetical protein
VTRARAPSPGTGDNARVRRLVATLLAAGSIAGLAGCGGGESSGVDVEAYASSVCSAIAEWQDKLEQGSAVLASRTQTEQSLAKVRTQFVTFFSGARDETATLLEKVEEAGVPDLSDGEEVSAAVLAALRRFDPILVEAQRQARALPVGNERVFTMRAQTLGADFRAEALTLPTLFETVGDRFDAPELTEAVQADASCAGI